MFMPPPENHLLLNHVYGLIEQTCEATQQEFTGQELRLEQAFQRIHELEQEVERHALLTEMLLRLCVERGVASEEDMARVLKEIDIADGTEDGRLTREPPRS